jgi:hypothetical protein
LAKRSTERTGDTKANISRCNSDLIVGPVARAWLVLDVVWPTRVDRFIMVTRGRLTRSPPSPAAVFLTHTRRLFKNEPTTFVSQNPKNRPFHPTLNRRSFENSRRYVLEK